MAFIHSILNSETLGMDTDINILIPDDILKGEGSQVKYPLMYLLHGGGDNYSAWLRNTDIERYSNEYKIGIVMPSAELSFYCNMAHGYKYFTYITEELPRFVCSMFPFSREEKNTFIGGLSMGGYGAFRIALTKPKSYRAAASFSGGLDVVSRPEVVVGPLGNPIFESMHNVFGTLNLKNTQYDLLFLANQLVENGLNPPLLFETCGLSDTLYEIEQNLRTKLMEAGISIHYEEWEGNHSWTFWDESIQSFLSWLKVNCQDSF